MKTDNKIDFTQDPSHFIRINYIEMFPGGSEFRSILNVQSGAFACQGHLFYFDHLKQFAKDLANLIKKLEGKAELGEGHEPDFISFEASKLGHIIVEGELLEYGDCDQLLDFSFETDQSYLPPFLESINETLKSLKQE